MTYFDLIVRQHRSSRKTDSFNPGCRVAKARKAQWEVFLFQLTMGVLPPDKIRRRESVWYLMETLFLLPCLEIAAEWMLMDIVICQGLLNLCALTFLCEPKDPRRYEMGTPKQVRKMIHNHSRIQ